MISVYSKLLFLFILTFTSTPFNQNLIFINVLNDTICSQGCLYFEKVLRNRRGESSKGAVAITISNSEEGPVALGGWRLIAIGNPSQVRQASSMASQPLKRFFLLLELYAQSFFDYYCTNY